jgi:hypothetical protein
VSEVVSEPVIKSHTKKVKKDKKENTTTSSVAFFSFLEKASQEQKTAYDLVKRFSSEEKAVEVASRDNPLEAAHDFLQWCADNGGKAAARILEEQEKQAQREAMTSFLGDDFLQSARKVGYDGTVTYTMFYQWRDGALGERVIDRYTYFNFDIRDRVIKSMREYFENVKAASSDDDDDFAEQVAKRQAEEVAASGYNPLGLSVEYATAEVADFHPSDLR